MAFDPAVSSITMNFSAALQTSGSFSDASTTSPCKRQAFLSCRGWRGGCPALMRYELRSAYGAGSSFSSHQPKQPGCIDAFICSIKPPAGSNGEASSFLAEEDDDFWNTGSIRSSNGCQRTIWSMSARNFSFLERFLALVCS